MFSVLLDHSYFMEIVLVFLALSILFQIITGLIYRKIIRETDNMSVTENRFLKQCKLKFSNCYELNEGNINIPVFVDKFMSQIRFAGISLSIMTHLSGQFMLLSVFAAGIGACKGIIEGDMLGELLPYYIASLFGLYAYFSVSSFVDVKRKSSMLRTNLIDYLENHLVKHLNLAKEKEMQPYIIRDIIKEETDSVKEAGEEIQKAEGQKEEIHPEEIKKEKIQIIDVERSGSFSGEEQEELEELLQEFLA